jgi:hypothetical protein
MAFETPSEPYFPYILPMETIQGGKTIRTYQMPPWAERVQYVLKTNGRPMKATVQLWLGPERTTHTMEVDMMNGDQTPFRATLKFKKMNQVLKISTSSSLELPVLAGVSVPSEERSKELAKNTERLWATSPKLLIQGGSTEGGGGAIRTFEVDPTWEAVQIVVWAIDTGKKSFRCEFEALQGPNNKRQTYKLQCGGGSQPYHCVVETPGAGWVLRFKNKKFMEDGLFQIAVVEYKLGNTGMGSTAHAPRQWWQSG